MAGRYEGIDERAVTTGVDEELSIGDYVLSGGETCRMVVMTVLYGSYPTFWVTHVQHSTTRL